MVRLKKNAKINWFGLVCLMTYQILMDYIFPRFDSFDKDWLSLCLTAYQLLIGLNL